jgi:hypothetical protein
MLRRTGTNPASRTVRSTSSIVSAPVLPAALTTFSSFQSPSCSSVAVERGDARPRSSA